MKSIFICCGNLKAGGAERVISILSNKFVHKGLIVDLYTWYNTDIFYEFDERVQTHQIPIESKRTDYYGQMKWFRKEAKKKLPDVILSFLAPFNILTVFSLVGLKIPVLVAERNDPYFVSPSNNAFWKIVRNIAYKMADGILVQTQVNKSHFPKYLQNKSTIIYNPVTFSETKIGIALNTPKKKEIVSVTRLEKQKNIDMLIQAYSIFQKNHPDYTLTIYGDGAERNRLEKKIKEMNLQDKIFLPGRKQNVHDLIIGASIFAMASNFEGMSNSLIEAMCLGLPCISTRVSGAVDLIKNDDNGLLVDIGNVNQLSIALSKLAEDDKFRLKIGKNATRLYDFLNVDIVAQEWLEYISKYTNENKTY